jgi:RNA-binding protein YhbY
MKKKYREMIKLKIISNRKQENEWLRHLFQAQIDENTVDVVDNPMVIIKLLFDN